MKKVTQYAAGLLTEAVFAGAIIAIGLLLSLLIHQ
jgi:hypothetical protein